MDFENNHQIVIDNDCYYFDIERIFQLLNYSESHKTMEREITDTYKQEEDEDGISHMNAIGKTVREISGQGNTNMDNIKYDLIKTFILKLIDSDIPSDFSKPLSFSMELCINTLIEEKILIKKNY